MKHNHDQLKTELTNRIQKFGKWAVRLTWFAVVWELLRLLSSFYMYRIYVTQYGEGTDFLSHIQTGMGYYDDFWKDTLPNTAILIAILVLTVILYRRIRKDGVPFTQKNVKTLRICTLLMGIRAGLPLLQNLPFLPALSFKGYFRQCFVMIFEKNLSVWFFGMLFLCTEIAAYGAALQQESDETL